MRVTFVLPGMSRSGGVRVTLEMANCLLARGCPARVAYKQTEVLGRYNPRIIAKKVGSNLIGLKDTDWRHEFTGEIQTFRNLNQVHFEKKEVVIAVGSMTIKDVEDLPQDVIKVRYCHGFPYHQVCQDFPDHQSKQSVKEIWGGAMTTICVSKTLVPELEIISGNKVSAVIPNGIRSDLYYDERIPRDGVCMLYHTHPIKDPQVMLELFGRFIKDHIPLYIFGTPRRPKVLPKQCYWRFPAIPQARELFNRSKIFILPSIGEGLPGPVLEAMACGCAVVSTANLGSLEIIKDRVNGIIAPIGDPSKLFKYAQELLQDDMLRGKLVQSANKTVAEFSWDNAAVKMEAFLATLK